MKLKNFSSIVSSDELCYPFNLQSSNDIVVQRTKTACEIVGMSIFNNNNIQSKLQLSLTKTNKPTTNIDLEINKNKVFTDCNLNEKNFIMLNSNYFPDCALKNTHYIKCLLGPSSKKWMAQIVACLTSAGIIELFTYNADTYELEQMDVNLSEMRKKSINMQKEIVKFETFYNAFNDIAYNTFEWCPLEFDDFKILIAVTKSDNVIFYSVQKNDTAQEICVQIEDASKNLIKWMHLKDEHFLLVGTIKGNLRRYKIDLQNNGKINGICLMDEIRGKSKIPIGNITVDYNEDSKIVLCTKTHTLEVFHFKENEAKLVLTKYIDLTITGLEICDKLEYLITTLNSKVYHVKLINDTINNEVTLSSFDKIEFVNSDDEQFASKHAFYGIASSKNKVLAYISCYPLTVSNWNYQFNLNFEIFLSFADLRSSRK